MALKPSYDVDNTNGFDLSDTSERHQFIMKVYAILMCMLSVTIGVSALFMLHEDVHKWVENRTTGLLIFSFVFVFVFIGIILCIPQARYNFPVNFICLSIVTLLFSIIIGIAVMPYDPHIVFMALITTLLITLILSLFACQTKYDFTGAGPYLLAVLLGLIFLGVINIFVQDKFLQTLISAVAVIIFSCYIVYDTQLIVKGNHSFSIQTNEYIFGALSLYLDIINLFLNLLTLMSNN